MFKKDSDYELYLLSAGEAAARHHVSIDAYVLMTNHVHLVMTPEADTGIPLTMQSIGRRYVFYFNSTYGRTGGLFDGRYRCLPIESEEYWFTCVRYVELNPVRAGMVASPEQHRWSSYDAHAFGTPDRLVTPHAAYIGLGTTPEVREHAWRTICSIPVPSEELEKIRESIRKSWNVARRLDLDEPRLRGAPAAPTLSRVVQGSDPGDDP